MIPILIEAAVRSLLVGLVVAVGLRVFRVRNVLAQKAAWGLVLITAFAMPVLLPLTARWRLLPKQINLVLPAHPMTLLEELQARIQAKSSSGRQSEPVPVRVSEANPSQAAISSPTRTGPGGVQHSKDTEPRASRNSITVLSPGRRAQDVIPAEKRQSAPLSGRFPVSFSVLVFGLYLGVAALLLLRLVLGMAATLRLWHSATPIPTPRMTGLSDSLRLRASNRISSPLTIGSAILLPANYETWDPEKLRIVLAHERSHVHQGDFYLQFLACVYAALAWFSPLGWWLKRQLADLAEAISDRAGIEAAESRTSYAQILLEFAAAPRPSAVGVAMARPGSLARRIERLLNDHAFRQSFAGGPRALVGVVLVPLALFAATAMVPVEAARNPQASSDAWNRPSAIIATHTPIVQSEVAGPLEQIAGEDASDDLAVEPLAAAASASPEQPAPPEPGAQAPESIEIAAAPPDPPRLPINSVIDAREEGNDSMSFDRTLSVSGQAQLVVTTGSGNIHLTRGSGSQIHIRGRIRVTREGSEEEARQIAANPPIEQSSNIIRVGRHEEDWHGISIDYQIEAPAGTLLAANSGSGDIVDEGVGQNAKLETGSGDIRASGLEGPFTMKTGSGNITAEQTAPGDVKAETGSGNIEINGVRGTVFAHTGSGDIKATGTPSEAWTLRTGSGNIDLWPGNAPLTLDASTGSGSVTTDHEMLVQGSLDQHHIKGNLNGGGPTVHAETGSGDVHVH
jgi:beta-lactamase regulating signal transducer with metallopeptidase domain